MSSTNISLPSAVLNDKRKACVEINILRGPLKGEIVRCICSRDTLIQLIIDYRSYNVNQHKAILEGAKSIIISIVDADTAVAEVDFPYSVVVSLFALRFSMVDLTEDFLINDFGISAPVLIIDNDTSKSWQERGMLPQVFWMMSQTI